MNFRLETKRVLNFRRDASLALMKLETAAIVFQPTLIEDKKYFVSRACDPANPALPTETAGLIVELNQIRQRHEGRERIVRL